MGLDEGRVFWRREYLGQAEEAEDLDPGAPENQTLENR